MHSDLSRFQQRDPELVRIATAEIEAGHRRTQWTAALLPQIAGLPHNAGADVLGIRNRTEAEDYLLDGHLFREYGMMLEALRNQLVVGQMKIVDLLGEPDDQAFVASLTLVRGICDYLTGNGFAQMIISCDELLRVAAAQGYQPDATTEAFLAA